MLFIANALPLNGGTTFLLRMCRELHARGEKVGVLVLFNQIDVSLENEIKKYAEVIHLKDFSSPIIRVAFKSQLGSFLPIDFERVNNVVDDYGRQVHVMGGFGLLFLSRYIRKGFAGVQISVGIYHQNEFMFEGVSYYFASKIKQIFSGLNSKSVVFFNENSRDSYSVFFEVDYSSAALVPVGVNVPEVNDGSIGSSYSSRILSIGNLYDFKTYNEHVINCLPSIIKVKPDVSYEIYGEGPNEVRLRALVHSLGLERSVFFKGAISYGDLPKVLEGSFLFVGSGTSIVEASAFGIPSIIGIESSLKPVTYGFLSDAIGYSYHEISPTRQTVSIESKVLSISQDKKAWDFAAEACKQKAAEFSIGYTVDGFLSLQSEHLEFNGYNVAGYSNVLSCISFLICALKSKSGLDRAFLNRRNQGTLV